MRKTTWDFLEKHYGIKIHLSTYDYDTTKKTKSHIIFKFTNGNSLYHHIYVKRNETYKNAFKRYMNKLKGSDYDN